MVKLLSLALTITLLTACGGSGHQNRAEELTLSARGKYLSMTGCAGRATITADYGQRVYTYDLEFSSNEEGTALTLLAPETVAGMKARLPAGGASLLEFDGAVLETGPLDEDGLTPISALPVLLEELKTGYLEHCALEIWEEGQALRLLLRNPALSLGEGRETTIWLDAESLTPIRGELSVDGDTVIQCEFSTFGLETVDN